MTKPIRKLAAIVFTDIVGFTKLTAEDQQKASDLLDLQRSELKPIVETFRGQWVKEMGDGLILTFDTITDAVRCTIKIQKTARAIENLSLRIGIHQGEILEKENDIIGDDVNVASRIEPFSAPGGIAISNKVNDAIIRESDYETKYLGKPKLKGVGQKVEVYCITSQGLPETNIKKVSAKLELETEKGIKWNIFSLTGAALTLVGLLFWINISFLRIGHAKESGISSIAILPFNNKGQEKDNYFAYGISSDFSASVANTGRIRVIGINDIERLDYLKMTNQELSDELEVRYVARGSLWKLDTLFQLSMELYDTETAEIVWSNRWETSWSDLSLIKDDLTEKVLGRLNINILKDPEQTFSLAKSEAYEFYLKAKYKFEKRKNAEDLEISRGFYQKAIQLDSTMVMAARGLGLVLTYQDKYDQAEEIYKKMRRFSKKSDNKIGLAYSIYGLGVISTWRDNDSKKAMEYYNQSVSIAEEIDLYELQCRLYTNLSSIYASNGDNQRAQEMTQKMQNISKEFGDDRMQAQSLLSLSYMTENPGKKFEYYKEVLKISKKIKDKNLEGKSLQIISEHHRVIEKDYKKALILANESVEIFNQLGDYPYTIESFNILHKIYKYMTDFDRALDFAKRSLEMAKVSENNQYILTSLSLIGQTYLYELNNQKIAFDYFVESLKLAEEISNTDFIYLTIAQMGDLYQYTGDYEKALDYVKKGYESSKKNGNKNHEISSLNQLGILSLKVGLTVKGIEYLHQEEKLHFNIKSKKSNTINNLLSLGYGYFLKEDYSIANQEYLEKGIALNTELQIDINLFYKTISSLCNKKNGRSYDKAELEILLSSEKNIDFFTYYYLYELLGEFNYLKTAYNKIIEKGMALDRDIRNKFYQYPVPSAIIKKMEVKS